VSPSKPGRNDPCPCGSGKKYKACHASEDRARESAAAPVHPLAQDLKEAMAVLGEEDTSRLARALARLEGLLTRWGPAPGLRFEAAEFDRHVSQALGPLTPTLEQDPGRARRELLVSTVRALGTRPFLDGLRASLLARASQSGLAPEDRQALCVAALLASATPKAGKFRPEDIPVLDVLFDVQFQEWFARQGEMAKKLEVLVAPLSGGGLSPETEEALRRARAGDVDALVQHVQSDPKLVQRVAQEAHERAARVEAKLREPGTPAIFTPEEELWLTCTLWEPLRAVKAGAEEAGARREAVNRLIQAVKDALDPDFLAGLLERLRAKAREAGAEEATRAWATDAAIAFEAEPARLVMAALFTARAEAQGRTAEEMVLLADIKARPVWTPEDLEPYRKYLEEELKLPASAERIRRCQEWLRAHPVRLEG
jgi:hypothetical protein